MAKTKEKRPTNLEAPPAQEAPPVDPKEAAEIEERFQNALRRALGTPPNPKPTRAKTKDAT